MKDLVDIQWDWVNWLIKSRNGREWLDTHINSPMNIQRLHRIIIHRQYDSVSGLLLNYLLTEFQKDESIKSKWTIDYGVNNLIRRM